MFWVPVFFYYTCQKGFLSSRATTLESTPHLPCPSEWAWQKVADKWESFWTFLAPVILAALNGFPAIAEKGEQSGIYVCMCHCLTIRTAPYAANITSQTFFSKLTSW